MIYTMLSDSYDNLHAAGLAWWALTWTQRNAECVAIRNAHGADVTAEAREAVWDEQAARLARRVVERTAGHGDE